MRTFRFIAVSLVFAAFFAVSAFAQTQTAGKIGLVNTLAFDDDKAGITKYVAAWNSLEAEFKPLGAELQTLGTRIQNLEKEITDLQTKLRDPNNKVPIPQTQINSKLEEYEKLAREFKFKQEDAKARYERRQETLLGPIRQDISTALQEFAKKNGYSIILDAAKLHEAGLLLGLDDAADVTKQFIVFYNARPATTATK